jgi:hypothetical protein
MTDLQFVDYYTERKARTIPEPRVFGWRVNPMEHHQVLNQLLRRDKRAPLARGAIRGQIAPRRESINTKIDAAVRKQFAEHARRWQQDTSASSSITDIALHPSYQRIIGMGQMALPLIFRELKKSLDHWFWALHYITEENPVPEEQQGDLEAMRARWLEWGRTHGYIA